MECGWNKIIITLILQNYGSLNPCSNGMRMELLKYGKRKCPKCLNPCSNGMRMEQILTKLTFMVKKSLNPCSNGMRMEPGHGSNQGGG